MSKTYALPRPGLISVSSSLNNLSVDTQIISGGSSTDSLTVSQGTSSTSALKIRGILNQTKNTGSTFLSSPSVITTTLPLVHPVSSGDINPVPIYYNALTSSSANLSTLQTNFSNGKWKMVNGYFFIIRNNTLIVTKMRIQDLSSLNWLTANVVIRNYNTFQILVSTNFDKSETLVGNYYEKPISDLSLSDGTYTLEFYYTFSDATNYFSLNNQTNSIPNNSNILTSPLSFDGVFCSYYDSNNLFYQLNGYTDNNDSRNDVYYRAGFYFHNKSDDAIIFSSDSNGNISANSISANSISASSYSNIPNYSITYNLILEQPNIRNVISSTTNNYLWVISLNGTNSVIQEYKKNGNFYNFIQSITLQNLNVKDISFSDGNNSFIVCTGSSTLVYRRDNFGVFSNIYDVTSLFGVNTLVSIDGTGTNIVCVDMINNYLLCAQFSGNGYSLVGLSVSFSSYYNSILLTANSLEMFSISNNQINFRTRPSTSTNFNSGGSFQPNIPNLYDYFLTSNSDYLFVSFLGDSSNYPQVIMYDLKNGNIQSNIYTFSQYLSDTNNCVARFFHSKKIDKFLVVFSNKNFTLQIIAPILFTYNLSSKTFTTTNILTSSNTSYFQNLIVNDSLRCTFDSSESIISPNDSTNTSTSLSFLNSS